MDYRIVKSLTDKSSRDRCNWRGIYAIFTVLTWLTIQLVFTQVRDDSGFGSLKHNNLYCTVISLSIIIGWYGNLQRISQERSTENVPQLGNENLIRFALKFPFLTKVGKLNWSQFVGFDSSTLHAGQLSFDCWHNRIIEPDAADLIINSCQSRVQTCSHGGRLYKWWLTLEKSCSDSHSDRDSDISSQRVWVQSRGSLAHNRQRESLWVKPRCKLQLNNAIGSKKSRTHLLASFWKSFR